MLSLLVVKPGTAMASLLRGNALMQKLLYNGTLSVASLLFPSCHASSGIIQISVDRHSQMGCLLLVAAAHGFHLRCKPNEVEGCLLLFHQMTANLLQYGANLLLSRVGSQHGIMG